MVEGVTVTKSSQHAWVNNPGVVMRPLLASVLWQLILCGSISLAMLVAGLAAYTKPGAAWSDPAFRSSTRIAAYFVLSFFLFFALSGFLYLIGEYGRGIFRFDKEAKTVKTQSRKVDVVNRVKCITLNRASFFSRPCYTVNYLTAHAGPPGGDARLGSFRQWENAERVAQAIGGFLDVPVQDKSASARV